ncbi:MAG TPA: CpaD family pilus assembly protein [Pseudolabrys sp.]|jgi:pilus assembly protein CpaD|nr:CpaD family pilus assembly protein [Pseudolabrys sp.]
MAAAFSTSVAQRRKRVAQRLLAAGGLAAMLAGCYPQQQAAIDTYPVDIRDRHPITIREGRQTVQVFVGHGRGGLLPSERADVLSFAQGWRNHAMGGVVIDVPSNRATGRATADSMREIFSILAASGIPRRAVYVRRHPSAGGLATIKLSYSRLVAEAGPCGLWPKDIGPAAKAQYLKNQPYWNFGCAAQHNLAAMVADPVDLVQPRGETPIYMERRSVAIDKWRKGEDPSGKYGNYDSVKIGDVGK